MRGSALLVAGLGLLAIAGLSFALTPASDGVAAPTPTHRPGATAEQPPAPSTMSIAAPPGAPAPTRTTDHATATTREDDAPARLIEALRQADREASGPEVLEVRRQLREILRRRPDLASTIARTLAELENRELAFAIARTLVPFAREPNRDDAVRDALLETARSGAAAPREAALHVVIGTRDPEVAAIVADAFFDESAATPVRAVAAFILADGAVAAVDPATADRVLARARAIVDDPDAPRRLQAETFDLLLVQDDATDRARARRHLHDPRAPLPVALAAARVLMAAGEPDETIRAALEARRPTTGPEEVSLLHSALAAFDGGPSLSTGGGF